MRNLKSLFVNPFTLLLALMFLVAAVARASGETPKAKSHHELGADPKGYDPKYSLVWEKDAIKRGPLTAEQMADMGLRPVRLQHKWKGYNYHREVEGGRWILETLPVGTLVAVDDHGNQIYKVDCANRLVWLDERPCPVCAESLLWHPHPAGPGIGRRIWNWLWTPLPSWSWWPYYGSVTIDVAGPNGPYTIDSYGSHRVVVTPQGDGHVTFHVYP